MLFWFIFAVALIVATVLLARYNLSPKNYRDWPWIVAVITGCCAFFMLLISFCCWCDYIKFEEKFEIQREIYEQIEIADENSILLVADIIEANAELAKYKASNNLYGFASFVPDRVHDIVPIGVE